VSAHHKEGSLLVTPTGQRYAPATPCRPCGPADTAPRTVVCRRRRLRDRDLAQIAGAHARLSAAWAVDTVPSAAGLRLRGPPQGCGAPARLRGAPAVGVKGRLGNLPMPVGSFGPGQLSSADQVPDPVGSDRQCAAAALSRPPARLCVPGAGGWILLRGSGTRRCWGACR
jgi:hypothetical protein